ncbi:MAG: hypothetical protein KIT84_16505 [Labilithrix sp.]|nr:hypothetical protein [Labilithrix sp.]MCW5812632.1 hypothetical protein [Labilithrix sp.]
MASTRTPKKNASVSLGEEVTASVRGEVRRAVSAATQRATLLRSIASQVSALTTEILVDSTPEQHRQRAHELRGVVLHGLTVLAELQHINGRLETLATLQETITAATTE